MSSPACLLALAVVLGASAASAGTSFNGTSLNGLSFNGLSFNGLSFNGANLNGVSLNGTQPNGSSGPGAPVDPEDLADATALVVQAVTLADGTRLAVGPGH